MSQSLEFNNLREAALYTKAVLREPEDDMFNKRWVIIAIILASLALPFLLGSCGIKGDLSIPKEQQNEG